AGDADDAVLEVGLVPGDGQIEVSERQVNPQLLGGGVLVLQREVATGAGRGERGVGRETVGHRRKAAGNRVEQLRQCWRNECVAGGGSQGQPVGGSPGDPEFRVGGLLTGAELLAAHGRLHFQTRKYGNGQLQEVGVHFPAAGGDSFREGAADPGVASQFVYGWRVGVLVIAPLISHRRTDRTAWQFEVTQGDFAVQYDVDGVQPDFLRFPGACGNRIHHVDGVVVGLICDEEGVVAGVTVPDDVAVDSLLHGFDVVVLVGHHAELTVAARIGSHTLPTFQERYPEVGLEQHAAVPVRAAGHVVAVGGVAIGHRMSLVDRTQGTGTHVFVQRDAVRSGAGHDVVHQTVAVQVFGAPVGQAVSVQIHTI